jgi:endonuclease/exonuclease/phosphatase family metal-dependent hydrolase
MGQRAAAARHLFSARGLLIGERSLRLVTLAAAPAVAALAVACAPTVNLSDPGGPKFEGSFAPAALAAPAEPDAGTQAPLRVVTFNVKLGREIDRAIEVLQSDSLRGADVVALQEMDEAGVARIARALRLNYIYYPGNVHPTDHRHFGPALLSPWPIERTWKLALPHLGRFRHQQRVATAAVLLVRGRPLQVYAVHLETQLKISDRHRADQIRAILDDAASTTAPVVIAGDFNSYGIGPVLTRAGYRWTTELAGPTISVFSWDHIFTRGLAPTGVGVVAHVHGASDHHPVWAVLVVGRES